MTHVLRIAHLRIAHQVANPEVGKREVHLRFTIFMLTTVYFQSSADDMKEFNVTGEVMICENRCFYQFPSARNASFLVSRTSPKPLCSGLHWGTAHLTQ